MAPRLIMPVLLLALCAMACINARPTYPAELPNLPTVNGAQVRGVGHKNTGGGGERNQFGKDFAAAGHKWTPELCKMDSDKDGFTNGQELGDPDCKWSKGQPSPSRGAPITHPGLASSKP